MFHQPRITIEHTVAEDTEAERHRVYAAFDRMREQIERMTSQAEFGVDGEHKEVLDTYKMFAYDEGWSRRINEAIDSGLTAEAAIERVQQRTRQRMRQIDDPLLADRMHDLEDLANRLLRTVSGPDGHRGADGAEAGHDPDRAQPRACRIARIRSAAVEGGDPRRRIADRARHHRRAGDGGAGTRPRPRRAAD